MEDFGGMEGGGKAAEIVVVLELVVVMESGGSGANPDILVSNS